MTTPDFATFEREGWREVARGYALGCALVARQCVPAMLAAARVGAGTRLLDVATGPGHLAGEAAALGALVEGLDFSPEMVAIARTAYPRASFRQGDAQQLPYADASFEAVTIAFGLFHFPEPARALAESFRVLRPGGRIAYSAWATPEPGSLYSLVFGALQQAGASDAHVPAGPPQFGFSERDSAEAALRGAGFHDLTFARVAQHWHVPTFDALLAALREGTVRIGRVFERQPPPVQARFVDALRSGAAKFAGPHGYHIPADAIVASGGKPTGT